MESTVNEKGGNVRGNNNEYKTNAGMASAPALEESSEHFQDLMVDVQALLSRVAHVADPEIARLRAKVEHGIAAARSTSVSRLAQVRRRAIDVVSAGDDYVRDRPWQSIGIAALAGIVVGVLVGRR